MGLMRFAVAQSLLRQLAFGHVHIDADHSNDVLVLVEDDSLNRRYTPNSSVSEHDAKFRRSLAFFGNDFPHSGFHNRQIRRINSGSPFFIWHRNGGLEAV